MIPHMRSLNFILCLAVATHCWAEDNSLSKQAFSSTENASVHIPVNSEFPEAQKLVNHGLQSSIMGEAELACDSFTKAIQIDPDCILAHVGILMSTPTGSDTYRTHLARLNELIPDAVLTPVEEWYLSTLLQYIGGDLHGTATAFKERSARYRRDSLAACWDIVLNHYAGHESTAELTGRADTLLQRHPENPLMHFCRALLEECSTSPSQQALASSHKAAEALSGSLSARLLAGRLLCNAGHPEEAITQFRKVLAGSSTESEANFIAHLSLVSALVQQDSRNSWVEALKEARKIAQKASSCASATNSGTLLHWEGRTTLLRLLVLQKTPPAGQAINTAAKACNAPEGDPVRMVQDCLVEAIRARSLAETNRKSAALEQLKKAENHFQNLQRAGEEALRQGGIAGICMQRSSQACMAALYRAKIALYPSTADIWKGHLDEVLQKPQPRFLPPVLLQNQKSE